MTILVTGASGFLGSHVARQLVARREDVRVMLRPSSTNRAIADLSLEYVTGDLRDPAAVARATQRDARASSSSFTPARSPPSPLTVRNIPTNLRTLDSKRWSAITSAPSGW